MRMCVCVCFNFTKNTKLNNKKEKKWRDLSQLAREREWVCWLKKALANAATRSVHTLRTAVVFPFILLHCLFSSTFFPLSWNTVWHLIKRTHTRTNSHSLHKIFGYSSPLSFSLSHSHSHILFQAHQIASAVMFNL